MEANFLQLPVSRNQKLFIFLIIIIATITAIATISIIIIIISHYEILIKMNWPQDLVIF